MRFRSVLYFAVGSCVALFFAGVAIVTQPFVRAIASRPPSVDPEQLRQHVRHLSVDLYPRSYDQVQNIEAAAQYILAQFKSHGAAVSVQDVPVYGFQYKNVVARFGPASGPVLVIGAHYDSYGFPGGGGRSEDSYSLQTHTPGADDNASGVAGLLELARLLGSSETTHAIELVAYTLEEPPHFRSEHMGSAWHARSLSAGKREVRLMLSLEMIGYFTDAPNSQKYPASGMAWLYSDRGDFIALVGRLGDFGVMRRTKAVITGATDLPVYSINAPPFVPGIDFSDHLSYWSEGFPALMLTDTAFLRSDNYHQAGDTYEKLDYRRMAKVVQAVYAITQNY